MLTALHTARRSAPYMNAGRNNNNNNNINLYQRQDNEWSRNYTYIHNSVVIMAKAETNGILFIKYEMSAINIESN